MKVLKIGVMVLVGLVVLLIGISFMLPKDYAVSRTVTMNVPAEKIYPLIATPSNWPKWGVWNRCDPNMRVTYSGNTSGAGAVWAWESKSEGNGTMSFTAAEINQRVSYTLEFPEFGMSSVGDLRLTPSADGKSTSVTWTTQGEMGGFPLWRYMALMMDRMVGPDFEGGLKNLKALAEG